MPPDVFLALASSGLSLIASLLFLVTPPPKRADAPDDPSTWVSFCLPPAHQRPPPLPRRSCAVDLSTASLQSVMTFRADSGEWQITLECAPRTDTPALQLHGERGIGAVSDLRWHGRAGLAQPTKSRWRQKPAKA